LRVFFHFVFDWSSSMKRISKGSAQSAAASATKSATKSPLKSPSKTPPDVASQVQGEGDYESAQRYSDSVHSFVESGKVAEAAEQAEPETPQVQQELELAERVGASHSKGEDPGVTRKSRAKP
jgi:hypothetical protein